MAVTTAWSDPSVSATGSGLDLATGDVLTEAVWDRLISNLNHLGKSTGTIACRARRAANQSLVNNTLTAITFDTEDIDTDTMLNVGGANPTRITIQTAGRYLLTLHLTFAASATGLRQAYVYLNNTTTLVAAQDNAPVAANETYLNASDLYTLAAGDYIELIALQSSGGALNVTGHASYSAVLSAVKV